jgi:hypothetical protein
MQVNWLHLWTSEGRLGVLVNMDRVYLVKGDDETGGSVLFFRDAPDTLHVTETPEHIGEILNYQPPE